MCERGRVCMCTHTHTHTCEAAKLTWEGKRGKGRCLRIQPLSCISQQSNYLLPTVICFMVREAGSWLTITIPNCLIMAWSWSEEFFVTAYSCNTDWTSQPKCVMGVAPMLSPWTMPCSVRREDWCSSDTMKVAARSVCPPTHTLGAVSDKTFNHTTTPVRAKDSVMCEGIQLYHPTTIGNVAACGIFRCMCSIVILDIGLQTDMDAFT